MARPADPLRDEVIETIRRLTAEQGIREGVRLAREHYPGVPSGSWGRWRQQAVGNVAGQRKTDGDAVASLAAGVREHIPAPEALTTQDDAVPATRRALDFWRMLDELDEDARLLRDFAMTTSADGKRKVKVPFALRDAHRMRCDLIRLALQHSETAWSASRMQSFFDAIAVELEAESPELQRRVIERLRMLSTEAEMRGF